MSQGEEEESKIDNEEERERKSLRRNEVSIQVLPADFELSGSRFMLCRPSAFHPPRPLVHVSQQHVLATEKTDERREARAHLVRRAELLLCCENTRKKNHNPRATVPSRSYGGSEHGLCS